MKEIKNRKVYIVLIVWLMVASILCSLTIGHAAYSREKYTKRVVTLQSGKGLMFSSDYLTTDNGTILPRIIPFNSIPSGDSVTVDVAICNYQFDEPTSRTCPVPILYTLKAWLIPEPGVTVSNGQFTIQDLQNSEANPVDLSGHITPANPCSFSNQPLTKSVRSINYYRLTFPKTQLSDSNVMIALTAEPEGQYLNYSGSINKLSGSIGIKKVDLSADRSWNGFVSEYEMYSSNSTLHPSDFSGFNFIAEGTSSGTLTISWDPKVVMLSEYYKKNGAIVGDITPTPSDNGWYKLVIPVNPSMDSGNNKTRYTFEFYRGTEGWEELTWDTLNTNNVNAKIKFNFI